MVDSKISEQESPSLTTRRRIRSTILSKQLVPHTLLQAFAGLPGGPLTPQRFILGARAAEAFQ